MRGAEDGAVPVGHQQIVAVFQAVRACLWQLLSATARVCLVGSKGTYLTGTETLLALLQLLQQAEIPGNFSTHIEDGHAVDVLVG